MGTREGEWVGGWQACRRADKNQERFGGDCRGRIALLGTRADGCVGVGRRRMGGPRDNMAWLQAAAAPEKARIDWIFCTVSQE